MPLSALKNEQVDSLFNYLNSADPHIKFTMEAPGNDGSISFLDTKCSPNSDHTIKTLVYRKPAHTDYMLDWYSNHPISAKKAVIHALIYKAKNVFFSHEILAKKLTSMEFFLKNIHPY